MKDRGRCPGDVSCMLFVICGNTRQFVLSPLTRVSLGHVFLRRLPSVRYNSVLPRHVAFLWRITELTDSFLTAEDIWVELGSTAIRWLIDMRRYS
jgi:hypothetical protein